MATSTDIQTYVGAQYGALAEAERMYSRDRITNGLDGELRVVLENVPETSCLMGPPDNAMQQCLRRHPLEECRRMYGDFWQVPIDTRACRIHSPAP